MAEWPDWLAGRNILEARYFGPMFSEPPRLVVLHRPAHHLSVAEYFHNGSDGRKVSTHFAPRAGGELVQCVSLRRVAWAQGGGVWKGDRRLNFCAVSIELPVPMAKPWPRLGWQTEASNALLRGLAEAMPCLTECIGHVDCDPARRSDPGSDLPWDLVLDGTGWESPHLGAG